MNAQRTAAQTFFAQIFYVCFLYMCFVSHRFHYINKCVWVRRPRECKYQSNLLYAVWLEKMKLKPSLHTILTFIKTDEMTDAYVKRLSSNSLRQHELKFQTFTETTHIWNKLNSKKKAFKHSLNFNSSDLILIELLNDHCFISSSFFS